MTAKPNRILLHFLRPPIRSNAAALVHQQPLATAVPARSFAIGFGPPQTSIASTLPIRQKSAAMPTCPFCWLTATLKENQLSFELIRSRAAVCQGRHSFSWMHLKQDLASNAGRQKQIRVRERQSPPECAARSVENAINHGYDGGVDSSHRLLRSDFSFAACTDLSVVGSRHVYFDPQWIDMCLN